jgi:beta-lactamase regulating signal transducer with metallopeptidase domain
MNGIETIVGEPAVQAIGWALLHFIWQGALIAAIAAVTLRALRPGAADVRYVVAAIALSLMATMPIVTAVQAYRAATGVRDQSAPAAATAPAEVPRVAALAAPAPAFASPGVLPAIPRGGAVERWMPLFVIGWMTGVVLLALRLVGGWLWIQRIKSHGAVAAEPGFEAVVRRLTRSLHISRRVRLLVSPGVDVPTVIGWIKPTVLLPLSALSGLTPLQIEAILAHELAHVRRHDYLVNLLQTLLETLLFYHPAVWWLSGRIRAEREHCCDDLAVSLCGDPVIYASALADLEELRGVNTRLVLAASGGPLLDRVRRLVAAPATHAGRGPAWLAAAAAVVLMLGIVIGAAGRQPVSAQAPDDVVTAIDPLRIAIGRIIHFVQNADDRQGPGPRPPAPPAPPVPPAPPAPPPGSDAAALPPALPERPDLPPPETPAPPMLPPMEMMAPGQAPPAPPSPPALPSPPAAPAPSSMSINASQSEGSGTFTWSSNGEKIQVKYHGAFELNEDDTDLVKLSPNGTLQISDGRWLSGRSVEFEADGSGRITRRFFVGSSERAFEPEGRQWLATTFPRFVRMSGFDAKGRVARFYKKGGTDAVLREIALIEGSYGKKTYYTELLRIAPADAATARRILSQAAGEISSDYEMSTLLIDGADRLLLDDASRRSYLEAAKTIESDYESKRVYMAALKRGPVSPALLADVLGAARSIDSDYEAATLLVEIARNHDVRGAVRAPFFALAETVSSSHEKGRVLQALLRRGALPEETLVDVLRTAGSLDSGYEAGQVLLIAARTQAITGPAREAYIQVADRLSDHEQSQALAALVRMEKR